MVQAPCFFPLQGHFLPCPSLQDLPLKTLGTKKGDSHGLFTDPQQLLHPHHLYSDERASNKYSSQFQPEARFIVHTTSVGWMKSQDKGVAEGREKL